MKKSLGILTPQGATFEVIEVIWQNNNYGVLLVAKRLNSYFRS